MAAAMFGLDLVSMGVVGGAHASLSLDRDGAIFHDFLIEACDSNAAAILHSTHAPAAAHWRCVGIGEIAAARAKANDAEDGVHALRSKVLNNHPCMFMRKYDEDHVRLTDREVECLQWIAAGKSDWQIGKILNISQKTMNYHVENVKRKFGVATRIQAVVAAMQQGQLAV